MQIGLIYTGGTIGCTQNPLTPLDNSAFTTGITDVVLPIIKSQHEDCSFTYIEFNPDGSTLDSTNLQPSDWCQVAQKILDYYPNNTLGNTPCDAFLVLHGTDSMAWTASALSFLLTGLDKYGNPNAVLDRPVIVTGSQLPLFYQNISTDPLTLLYNTDALQNICGSVEACYSGITESCLYFDAELYRGNRAVKTNASEFDAFSTPNYPSMGEYGVEFDLYTKRILPLPVNSTVSLNTASVLTELNAQLAHVTASLAYGDNMVKVKPFLSYPAPYSNGTGTSASEIGKGQIADEINSLVAAGLDGLILESYGEGNFPSGDPDNPTYGGTYNALLNATTQADPVVLMDCTQVIHGTVNATAYASGSWLSNVGARGAYDMTAIATLAKLNWLKALSDYTPTGGTVYDWDATAIGDLMQNDLRGEIMDIFFLDSRGAVFLSPGESISALHDVTTDTSAVFLNDPTLGPVLQTIYTDPTTGETTTTILWSALSSSNNPQNPPSDYNMPGNMVMQSDGNLVFYDNSNTAAYASGYVSSSVTTKLILEAGANNEPYLYVYDYRNNEAISVIYGMSNL
ncbi:asparaginase domain-containing protein [Colwellia psychrerythraea]|uniref:Asparaginase/glutaminase n=1 Tax=Colwellia psychrerythraea TaxID=28229 RepID=A0A099KWD5_COLPS|nr:asparaginase domain-containing protein [Colwellia psychrerythraea]KGJ94901.1 Asparaginase/glutaminase [Colwellia psychrerythraea]